MKVTVSVFVVVSLLGSGFAQQCCDFKDVSDAKDPLLNGKYRLTNVKDLKPNPDCKDGCIYEKDSLSFCFKAIPIAEAPTVDCEKASAAKLASELNEVNNVENRVDEIEKVINGLAGRRNKRAVPAFTSCDQVVDGIERLATAMKNKDFALALEYADNVLVALDKFNGCQEKRSELRASVAETKKVVQEKKAMIHKQLVESNNEAVAAGQSTAKVPSTIASLTTTPGTVMTMPPSM